MEISYDKTHGNVYICFQPEKRAVGCVEHTKEVVTDLVFVDYMADGSVYGVDIMPVENTEIIFRDLADAPTKERSSDGL